MTESPEMDLVEELQLRRWARMNYVPQHKRNRLHFITVSELEAMDRESGQADSVIPTAQGENRPPELVEVVTSRFVPLADYADWRWNPPHEELSGPKFIRFAANTAET